MTRKPRTSARDRIFETPKVVVVAPPESAAKPPSSRASRPRQTRDAN